MIPETGTIGRRPNFRQQLELLAFRLHVDGKSAATLRNVRSLAGTALWLELRSLLKEHAFTEAEIAYLMGWHPPGCPCWNCVIELNIRVRNHIEKLKRKPWSQKRRRLV